ncbi:MAG: hypothetical protein M9929_01110 [Burkholderiaceae bacterium]|nr:hypothetical protein [Burkholderiaceae bacterium]
MKRRKFVQSAALLPLVAGIPGQARAQALSAIPGTPIWPTSFSNLAAPYAFNIPQHWQFFAKAFNLPARPYGSSGLYVEFDIDNFAAYITTNAVEGKHFAINLYDNKVVAPFTGRAGNPEFGFDAISTGVGSAIGNLGYNGTVYQCVWLEAFRKGNWPNCQKEPSGNRDKILLDYGLGPLSYLANLVTVKVWSSKTPSGRYDIGIQVVDRTTGATLLSGSNPGAPALAVMDSTGYRISGPNAGTLDAAPIAEYSFNQPTVSVIAVTAGNVGTGINDTPVLSAGRYLFY